MPRKAKHPCHHPGCPNLTESRFCEQHQKEENKRYEKYGRDPATRKRYGRAWKRIRDSYVKTHPFCELCYEQGVLVEVEEVHHKIPLSEGGTHDRANLISLCKSCHAIQSNPEWEYAGVYADEGITGTSTKKRDEFNRLMKDCDAGKIDLVLVKSISRFARDTVDTLNATRHLKDLGVDVFFEREGIHSMSGEGELLLTLLASFAQAETDSLDRDLQDSIAELNIISEQMQIAIAENSRVALDQDEYEKRYAELTARYEKSKAKYDDIAEQIESKKAKRELFKGFIRTLEKQDGITYEFDAGIWSSLVQEVIVKSKDDIRFIFKNGFEVRV